MAILNVSYTYFDFLFGRCDKGVKNLVHLFDISTLKEILSSTQNESPYFVIKGFRSQYM